MAHMFFDYQSWSQEIDKEQEAKRREAEKHREAAKIARERNLRLAQEKHGRWWIGPAEVRIPWSIFRVPAVDGYNYAQLWLQDEGEYTYMETLVGFSSPKYTLDTYRDQFATKHSDGHWYWSGHGPDDSDSDGDELF